MSYFFNTAFLAALKADQTIMNTATVKMVLFPTAPAFMTEEGTTDPRYMGINSVDTLASTLGWGPYVSHTVISQTVSVNTSAKPPSKYVIIANPFDLPDNFPTTYVKAIAFVYMGPNAPMTNNIMFVTDTPLIGGTILTSTDAVVPLTDQGVGKWLFSWSLADAAAPLAISEGPLALLKGPRAFDQARVQHIWIYPQRINMIANPSFELNAAFWRSNGALTQERLAFPTVKAASVNNLVLSGTQTVDTVDLVAADRVLVKNQSVPSQNGVYVVAAGAWTRATDADAEAELFGSMWYVLNGTQRLTLWYCITVKPIVVGTTNLVFDQRYWGGGNFCGHTIGTILESNMFPMNMPYKREDGWTIQARVKSDGEIKVGLIAWEPDFASTVSDWGREIVGPDGTMVSAEAWHPSGGYINIRTIRRVGDVTTGLLRLETNGTYMDIDQVCVEPGMMPMNKDDWPYFDGSNQYQSAGDYSWYGNPHASYSCWYNNRSAVMGRLFAWGLDPEDQAPGGVITDEETIKQGLVYQWVPAGTPVQEHYDVLYPNDPKTPISAVTGSPLAVQGERRRQDRGHEPLDVRPEPGLTPGGWG